MNIPSVRGWEQQPQKKEQTSMHWETLLLIPKRRAHHKALTETHCTTGYMCTITKTPSCLCAHTLLSSPRRSGYGRSHGATHRIKWFCHKRKQMHDRLRRWNKARVKQSSHGKSFGGSKERSSIFYMRKKEKLRRVSQKTKSTTPVRRDREKITRPMRLATYHIQPLWGSVARSGWCLEDEEVLRRHWYQRSQSTSRSTRGTPEVATWQLLGEIWETAAVGKGLSHEETRRPHWYPDVLQVSEEAFLQATEKLRTTSAPEKDGFTVALVRALDKPFLDRFRGALLGDALRATVKNPHTSSNMPTSWSVSHKKTENRPNTRDLSVRPRAAQKKNR